MKELVRLVRTHGPVGGVLQRLRAGMDLAAVDERAVGELRAHVGGHEERLTSTAGELGAARAELEATRGELDAVQAELAALQAQVTAATAPPAPLWPPVADADDLLAAHHWHTLLPSLVEPPLVSVIVPTCNRPKSLERALRSVLAQSHEHLEVLVVDDGSEPAAERVVAALGDPRLRLVDHDACANSAIARNAALATARGSIVAYLDDDCAMGPDWLAAVVHAFVENPGADVAYGARLQVIDGRFRYLLFPFDRRGLEQVNPADTNVLAHRSGLPEARWDPAQVHAGDWELLWRLTADKDPLVLTALAAAYDHRPPDRISLGAGAAAEYDAIRALLRGRRELRDAAGDR